MLAGQNDGVAFVVINNQTAAIDFLNFFGSQYGFGDFGQLIAGRAAGIRHKTPRHLLILKKFETIIKHRGNTHNRSNNSTNLLLNSRGKQTVIGKINPLFPAGAAANRQKRDKQYKIKPMTADQAAPAFQNQTNPIYHRYTIITMILRQQAACVKRR